MTWCHKQAGNLAAAAPVVFSWASPSQSQVCEHPESSPLSATWAGETGSAKGEGGERSLARSSPGKLLLQPEWGCCSGEGRGRYRKPPEAVPLTVTQASDSPSGELNTSKEGLGSEVGAAKFSHLPVVGESPLSPHLFHRTSLPRHPGATPPPLPGGCSWPVRRFQRVPPLRASRRQRRRPCLSALRPRSTHRSPWSPPPGPPG